MNFSVNGSGMSLIWCGVLIVGVIIRSATVMDFCYQIWTSNTSDKGKSLLQLLHQIGVNYYYRHLLHQIWVNHYYGLLLQPGANSCVTWHARLGESLFLGYTKQVNFLPCQYLFAGSLYNNRSSLLVQFTIPTLKYREMSFPAMPSFTFVFTFIVVSVKICGVTDHSNWVYIVW